MNNKYLKAYKNINNLISMRLDQKKYIAMGYTSNLDIICDFDVEIVNKLLEEHMREYKLNELPAKESIKTLEDFLSTVVYFCKNGIGGEVDIEDPSIIENYFATKNAIGGTCVQAAMALASVKCPSIVHLTDDSPEVCEILKSPFIFTISDNEEMIHTNEVLQKNEQEIHLIIQFKKGDVIRLHDQKIDIPTSNRLIITKITVNETIPFVDAYFRFIENNAKHITSNVLSGFNVVKDEKILLERLEYVKDHVKRYKKNNEQGIVFFEDAHYHSEGIKKLCLDSIYKDVDIVSLNEEELDYTLDMCGNTIDIDDIISCVEGMKYLREMYNIQKGVIVHTKDYSMYVGDKLHVNIEDGLIYGNLLATSKAMNGNYGNMEDIRKILELPLSKKGIKYRDTIIKNKFDDEVVLVPTKYIDKPKYTIGLGDSFVAGVQICFI